MQYTLGPTRLQSVLADRSPTRRGRRVWHHGTDMKWRSLEESSPATDARPLREIFAKRKELIAKYIPAETPAIHAQAVAELKARHLASNILTVGAKSPAFELPDHNGQLDSSSDLLAKGPLVLCVIRTLVPFLRGTDGSHDAGSAADRADRRNTRRHFAADGEAVVLHARSAQNALSAALRWRQQSRAAVWADLPRAAASASFISACVRQLAFHER